MRYDGTRATLRGRFNDEFAEITVHGHRGGAYEKIPVETADGSGHGGGDSGLLHDFAQAIRTTDMHGLTSARASVESHLLGFAAERSRISRRVIDMAS
jgi:hypothetical protein